MAKKTQEVNLSAEGVLDAVLTGLSDDKQREIMKKFWSENQVKVVHEGTAIKLPATPREMDIPNAISALNRIMEEENEVVDVVEWIDGYPFDAAVAFIMAMKEVYGWATPVPTPTFFGKKPPDMKTVRIGPDPGDVVQVPIGSFKLPNLDHIITTGFAPNKAGRPTFYMSGKIKNKDRAEMAELVETARRLLKVASIYKGKAIRLSVNEFGGLDYNLEPEFLATKHIVPENLILPDDTAQQVHVSLFTPVLHTPACRQHKVPLKRGVLLEGIYGTGKTLTANVAMKHCVDNGWTYILLDRVQGLRDALEFAKAYQPAMIFAEDIDRVIAERDEAGNDLLNTIDGTLTKDAEIIVVLTTNHIEVINKAMLRPGRLDAIINIPPPDADAVQKLVRLYARDLLAPGTDLSELGELIAGNIPATIREVVERAKLGMISRGGEEITEGDLIVSAKSMDKHLLRLNEAVDAIPSVEQRLGEAFADLIQEKMLNGHGGGDELATAEQVEAVNGYAFSADHHAGAGRNENAIGFRGVNKKLDAVVKAVGAKVPADA